MKQCTLCKVDLTEENKHKRYTRCVSCVSKIAKKYSDSHKPQLITAQQMRRQRDSGITDMQIAIVNAKWDKWYPNYVIYRKSKNENFEYSMSLTVLKKRQIMGDWLKNEKMDFSVI